MQRFLHPVVAAEQTRKQAEKPDLCHFAAGAVHSSAQKPNPQWCVRPIDHMGWHMPAAIYEQHQARGRERQRQKRKRDREAA